MFTGVSGKNRSDRNHSVVPVATLIFQGDGSYVRKHSDVPVAMLNFQTSKLCGDEAMFRGCCSCFEPLLELSDLESDRPPGLLDADADCESEGDQQDIPYDDEANVDDSNFTIDLGCRPHAN